MTICDWCNQAGRTFYERIITDPKQGCGKEVNLCPNCQNVLEKYKTIALFEAAKIAKNECAENNSEKNGEKRYFDIYEEGFAVMECRGRAHYVGSAYGYTFLDACKNYIKNNPGKGEICIDPDGNQYACNWGCRWFETLAEAQDSFG